ncbi:3-oxoacyl-ACP synthase [Novosphingobium piscinae]|uniref:3-oxoacyl-ACP synthase n=1 Tax=Novosphingobium piscinae TaxID=1507448 RepID=A0A7X1FWU5_9SPHN|nr:3-oxoacyl-ACP synthase [Novosphingobium piscinae]MBC2668480.1 3-oxoacyl-ACP synthase [Novosphingobium piscinae]
MIPSVRTTFCFGKTDRAARVGPIEVRLGDRSAEALATLVPLLGCGEEAAAIAFDGLAARDSDLAAARALREIAAEERVHDRLLYGLAESLPPVEVAALRRAARRFHIDLGRGSTCAHLARIAAIDAGVCLILSRLLRPGSPVAEDRSVADRLARIRLDETRHVRLSRSLVLARANGKTFEDVAHAARVALADVIMLAADAFEDLAVDPARLQADLAALSPGLLRP